MSGVAEARERTLILCIDGDDDIGLKAEVETPVVGRDENVKAATLLLLSDPEEADANAMFGAVKLYDRLSKEYPDVDYEVATVSGAQMGGIDADLKMIRELTDVLSSFEPTGVVLVTDGYSDESLVPIIQSRIPITSIHHVVVKHSERIEETWAVMFRYLKMLMEDPYYSRITLGVPGIILVILGFLLASNQLENAGMVVTVIMGIVLFVKGFGWDEKLAMIRLRLPPIDQQITMASTGGGIILSLVGFYQGLSYSTQYIPQPAQPFWDLSFWAQYIPTLLGAFLMRGIDFIILGVMVSLIGGLASYYMQRDEKIWQNVVGMIVVFWLRFIIVELAKVLMEPGKTVSLWSPLVFFTIASVTTTIASVVVIYSRFKRITFR